MSPRGYLNARPLSGRRRPPAADANGRLAGERPTSASPRRAVGNPCTYVYDLENIHTCRNKRCKFPGKQFLIHSSLSSLDIPLRLHVKLAPQEVWIHQHALTTYCVPFPEGRRRHRPTSRAVHSSAGGTPREAFWGNAALAGEGAQPSPHRTGHRVPPSPPQLSPPLPPQAFLRLCFRHPFPKSLPQLPVVFSPAARIILVTPKSELTTAPLHEQTPSCHPLIAFRREPEFLGVWGELPTRTSSSFAPCIPARPFAASSSASDP